MSASTTEQRSCAERPERADPATQLDLFGGSSPAPPPAAAGAIAVRDPKGTLLGEVLEENRETAYPFVAVCAGCKARRAGWSSSHGADMWLRHHAAEQCEA